MARDFSLSSEHFLASLDAEIERLQQVREQVAAALESPSGKKTKQRAQPKSRTMSEEGRRKIAAAQKARWAKQKREEKAQARKTSAKKTATKKPTRKAVPQAKPSEKP